MKKKNTQRLREFIRKKKTEINVQKLKNIQNYRDHKKSMIWLNKIIKWSMGEFYIKTIVKPIIL